MTEKNVRIFVENSNLTILKQASLFFACSIFLYLIFFFFLHSSHLF